MYRVKDTNCFIELPKQFTFYELQVALTEALHRPCEVFDVTSPGLHWDTIAVDLVHQIKPYGDRLVLLKITSARERLEAVRAKQ